MTTSAKPNINLVHESEAQRQYARVKIPATLRLIGTKKQEQIFQVADISAGGFSLKNTQSEFYAGEKLQGQLCFNIDGFKFVLDTEFQVKSITEKNQRIGCEFQNLTPKKTSALRYIITSFLSGDLVSSQDMIATLSRENFTNRRNTTLGTDGESRLKSVAAGTMTLLMFLIGLIAATFVAIQLYTIFFVVSSDSGVIDFPTQELTMPKAGEFEPLVAVGDTVDAGQAVGTVKLPVLEYLNADILTQNMNGNEIDGLLAKNLSGTLSSPCDCIVVDIKPNTQFLAQNTSVVTLASRDTEPTVKAYYSHKDAQRLNINDPVTIKIIGETQTYDGSIENIQMVRQNGLPTNQYVATIATEARFGKAYSGRPLTVTRGHSQKLFNDWGGWQ